MRHALDTPALLLTLLLAFLLCFAGTASGAYVDATSKNRVGVSDQNPNIHTYELGSLELEPHREITIWFYDPATGVVFYVRQNPWSKFDPLGLYLWGIFPTNKQEWKETGKANVVNTGKMFKGMAMAPVNASQSVAMALADPVGTVQGAGTQLKNEVVTLATDPGQAMQNYGSQAKHVLTDPEALGEAAAGLLTGSALTKQALKNTTGALNGKRGASEGPTESARDAVENVNPNELVSRQGPGEMTGNKVKRFRKSMERDGYDENFPVEYVEVDGQKIIKDGHHRTEAAKQARLPEIPAKRVDVSSEQAKKMKNEAIEAAGERERR